MKKKILSFALILAMMAAFVPFYAVDLPTVSAAGETVESGGFTIEDGVLIEYNGDDSNIVIPSTVKAIDDWAFEYRDSVMSITIPSTVTSIGDYVFIGCENLTSINVDSKNTKYASKDGVLFDKAFSTLLCYPMGKTGKSYTVPNSVTSIGEGAFIGSKTLTGITIPTSVKTIGESAFEECSGLTSIVIPDSVTSMGDYAFNACTGLTNVTLSNALTSISEYALSGCESLKSVAIPNSVKTIGEGAFSFCDGLTNVTIPNSVTSIGVEAFTCCENLKSVTLSNSLTTIGEDAFSYCAKLSGVTIPKSLTSIGQDAFCFCDSLASINVDSANTKYASKDGVLFNKNLTELLYYPPAKSDKSYAVPNGVTSIGNSAFLLCQNLTNVTIPNTVKTIEFCGFAGCTALTSVNLPNSVTSISEAAFQNCESLKSVTLPNTVTSIPDYAFYECFRLTEVTIPKSVTSIGVLAFINCKSLKDVYYTGTQEEWNKIKISSDNEPLTGAAIHYDTPAEELQITTQPADVTAKSGDTVIFKVKASGGEGLTYQWQLSDDEGKTWRTSSVKTSYYAATLTSKNDGRYVRCIVTDKNGNAVTSDAASMNLAEPKITVQPVDVKGTDGSTVKFTVKASGEELTYQWQLSDDQGKTWRNSSVKTDTYYTTLSSKNDGRYVRCIVTDKNGEKVTSDAASMSMTEPKITTQPADVTAKEGESVTFKVKASGEGLTYQWQLSDDQGKTWRNSSVKTSYYATTLSSKNDGRYVRCIVTDKKGGKVTSNAAGMKIAAAQSAVKITSPTRPTDVLAKMGDTVTFKVKASGEGLTYQWQLSDDQGKTWRNSSVKTSYYATTLSTKNDGRWVRCIVTDKYGNQATSSEFVMAAAAPTVALNITAQPANVTVKEGESAVFKVKASGEGLTYQWQLSDDQGKTWRNSSVKTSYYAAAVTGKNDGRYVRCIVTDKYGNSVTSASAAMKMEAAAASELTAE